MCGQIYSNFKAHCGEKSKLGASHPTQTYEYPAYPPTPSFQTQSPGSFPKLHGMEFVSAAAGLLKKS
jgi:hypothetical protein